MRAEEGKGRDERRGGEGRGEGRREGALIKTRGTLIT